MRLPRWVKRTEQVAHVPRSMTFDLVIDASKFVAGMDRAAEATRKITYRRWLAHERSLGRAYVGTMLDDLCRDYGFSPQVWRNPPTDPSRGAVGMAGDSETMEGER